MVVNTTVESPTQKIKKPAGRINYALSTQTRILSTTSQRKVSPKIEIKLGRKQFYETRWLFNQYGLKTPSWLRGKFLLNQYRRKCLNDNLREAQLDKAFCGHCQDKNDWSGLLHSLWHDINGGSSCI
jgi:hypothetical protein